MTIKARTRSCLGIVFFSIAAGSCAPKGPSSAACLSRAQQPSVRWSAPVNGLSLGVEVPEQPLVFIPKRDWTGSVLIYERDDAGRGKTIRTNPGGSWDSRAVLTVLLRNCTTSTVFWARDRDTWHVSFSGPDFEPPPVRPGSRPPPLRRGPVRLSSQEKVKIAFPLSGAFDIWPRIAEGEYTVSVSYSPERLLRFSTGAEHTVHPYDVPGFWTGEVSTPTIRIRVRHATPEDEPEGLPADLRAALTAVVNDDVDVRRRAAADLCIALLKRNGVWHIEPWHWRIPTEEGVRLEVQTVRASKQTPNLAVANMCAHCMGMLRSGAWRRPPEARYDPLEKAVIEANKATDDAVVRMILLVGLASSQSEAARDVVVAATDDSYPGVRKGACYLVECCVASAFGPIGNIHIGSSERDVRAAGQKIRAIYRWDKTLGAGWGRMRDGLQTRLVLEPNAVQIGQPVAGTLMMRNVSEETLSVPSILRSLQCFKVLYDKEYCLPKKKVLPPPLSKNTIAPGNQITIWSLRLDELFDLSRPGEYEAWLPDVFGALLPRSNRVRLEVEERDE